MTRHRDDHSGGGGRYDIEVGAGTWHFRGVLRTIGRSPSAFGFEPAS